MAELVAGPGFDPRVVVTRPDGRPEVYDLPTPASFTSLCMACQGTERAPMQHPKGRIFMCSPIDSSDGNSHFVCIDHLPGNVVIYDPVSDMCRDKTGQNVWRET